MADLTQPERGLLAAQRVLQGGRVSSDDIYDMAAVCLAQRADLHAMKGIIDRFNDVEQARYEARRVPATGLIAHLEALDWFVTQQTGLEDWQEAEARRWIATVCVLYEALDVAESELECCEWAMNEEGIGPWTPEKVRWGKVYERIGDLEADGFRAVDVDGDRWAWVHDEIDAVSGPQAPVYLTADEVHVMAERRKVLDG